MTTLPPDPEPVLPPPPSAYQRTIAAFDRITEVDRPELWITLRTLEEVLVDAKAVDARVAAGEDLPLAGTLLAVKDLIDVAGLPTTAGCPSYASVPETSATVVSRLTAAGSVVLGKTNLDQFATGLAGTRSPYGVVASALDRDKVAGGSSSGSAVAVALGLVDLALGTDTAGSGRVPAALNGVIGLKPTLGLVPKTGVVPASRSYDCVSLFARTLTTGQVALAVMTGPDEGDPMSRPWPADVRLSAGRRPRVAVPDEAGLALLAEAARPVFAEVVKRLRAAGSVVEPVDIAPLLEAGKLLYGGALVAERYAAVGEFLAGNPAGADPTVSGIILAAGELRAHDLAADQQRLAEARSRCERLLAGFDALVLPTVPDHPSIEEALADPVGVGRRLGVYTSFVNPLDLAAVAVPAVRGPYGVTVVARAFEDQVALDLAAVLTDEQAPTPYPEPGADLVVFGAHLRGQPLNERLTTLGARFTGAVLTSEGYLMKLLPGDVPQPAVIAETDAGSALAGERWRLSPAGLGRFAAGLEPPFVLGRVELDDGSTPLAVLCAPDAKAETADLSRYECWRAYLRFASTAGRRDPG
ncbi:allophanate hydrolase [Amycolatopsis sp. H20-H5]|uniref:allophanate hydrolase n=1 Tax=Amycolatopsis sp. H20-H5 TaxID=3046309 RepID=UPI002DB60B51|nr:allophanate hydrolase [Amycolatopsis sp. H20-H5]MEC3977643.1 allophanate hydrolase [Amycolatopsis sp. H20-H5]